MLQSFIDRSIQAMTIEILGETDSCLSCQDESARAFGNKNEKVVFAACDLIFSSAAHRRDKDAIACLLECLYPWLMKWGVRHYRLTQDIAEDYAQDAMIKLLLRLRNLELPELDKGYGGFLAYAQTTLFNTKNNEFRRFRDVEPIDDETKPERPDPAAAADFERGEKIRLASALLSSLEDPFERRLVRLRHVYGLSIDEIIWILRPKIPDIETAQIYRALESALKKLRRHTLVRAQLAITA